VGAPDCGQYIAEGDVLDIVFEVGIRLRETTRPGIKESPAPEHVKLSKKKNLTK